MAKAHLLIDAVFEASIRIFLPDAEEGKYNGLAKSLLISSGREKILVDTGIGTIPKGPEFESIRRTLTIHRSAEQGTARNLKRLGVAPEEITAVVNTHLHNAHCGWNNLFPNAQFYIGSEEFREVDSLVSRDPNQNAYIGRNFENLKNVNRVKGRLDLTEDVSVIPTPGHTSGHQSVVVKLKNHNLVYCGDVAPLKVNLTTRTAMTGTDRKMLLKSMDNLLRIRNSKWLFTHDNAQLDLRQAYVPAN